MKSIFATMMATLLVVISGCTSETTTTPNSTATPAASSTDNGALSEAEASEAELPAVDSSSTETVDSSSEPQEPVAEIESGPPTPLTIGSAAPPLDIEHWVSDGNGAYSKVSTFEKDKVYVVEFWATWCGPCVRSMPHLVETQQKYKDSVQIISVSDEDLATVDAFLARPFNGGADGPETYAELTSVYCLTADPDRSVSRDYMLAAGQNGIPCCFIVGKTDQIEWIGHPMNMDESLDAVVNDEWDRESHAAEFKKEQALAVLSGQIYEAFQAGDQKNADSLLAEAKKLATSPQQLMQIAEMEMNMKLAPAGKLMQAGDVKGAIAEIAQLLETVDEGPMKDQITGILEQLRAKETQDAAKDTIEPAAE